MNVLNAHNVPFVLTTIVNIILYMLHLELATMEAKFNYNGMEAHNFW